MEGEGGGLEQGDWGVPGGGDDGLSQVTTVQAVGGGQMLVKQVDTGRAGRVCCWMRRGERSGGQLPGAGLRAVRMGLPYARSWGRLGGDCASKEFLCLL